MKNRIKTLSIICFSLLLLTGCVKEETIKIADQSQKIVNQAEKNTQQTATETPEPTADAEAKETDEDSTSEVTETPAITQTQSKDQDVTDSVKEPSATATPETTPVCTVEPTVKPTQAPVSSATPTPTKAPVSTATPTPTKVPASSATPAPTKAPVSTATPAPTKVPASTATPAPTKVPASTATPAPTKVPDIQPDESYIDQVASIVNQERAANGLSALTLSSTLSDAAQKRAKEMVELFSHTRPDGTSCFTVLDEYAISYQACGENIAYGYTSPQSVMDAWMNSEGHRANILNGSFGKIGVGCYKGSDGTIYWVQLFTD